MVVDDDDFHAGRRHGGRNAPYCLFDESAAIIGWYANRQLACRRGSIGRQWRCDGVQHGSMDANSRILYAGGAICPEFSETAQFCIIFARGNQ
jgi:hypothetical protein